MPNKKTTVTEHDPLGGEELLMSPVTPPISEAPTTTATEVAVPEKRRRPGRPRKDATTTKTPQANKVTSEKKKLASNPLDLLLNYEGSKVLIITPTLAEHVLEHCNTLNRKINKRWVTFLAESIKNGEWQLNGEPIIFSKTQKLIDGQHRLLAIVEADREVETYVTTNVEDKNFVSVDTGHSRSGSHVLTISSHVKNSFNVSATLNKLHRYTHKNYDFDGAHIISNRQLVKLLEKNKDVLDSVEFARKYPKGYGKSTIAFCHYVLSKLDKVMTDTLFTQLAMEAPTVPLVASLRKGTVKTGRSRSRIKQTVIIGSIFKTWNALRENDANASAIVTATEEFPVPA